MTDPAAHTAQLPPELKRAIDRFTAWARKCLHIEDTENKIDFTLYHYTDGQGLRGILESGRLWFTDYRHLNDPSELTHGIETARDVARLLCNGADGRACLFLETFVGLLRADSFNVAFEFFVASFSRERDDLGQWRAYPDNGRGYAIGFAPRMFHISKAPSESLGAIVGRVGYLDVVARHQSALNEAVEIFLATANANADLMRDKTVEIPFMVQFAREIIAQHTILTCLKSKHPAYEHEQEVRLIIGKPRSLATRVTTRLRGSEIVPYIAYPMPLREPQHIAEIVVGPAAPPDAERTVRAMLNSLGLDPNIEVGRSDIPYRPS